jgi:hypothetical protein
MVTFEGVWHRASCGVAVHQVAAGWVDAMNVQKQAKGEGWVGVGQFHPAGFGE